jgi:hypothetical protein
MHEASRPSHHASVLSTVNESTKWVVSFTAAGFLALRHDAPVMWCLIGAIVSAFLSKVSWAMVQLSKGPAKVRDDAPTVQTRGCVLLCVYVWMCG